jgi:hypothetical protein
MKKPVHCRKAAWIVSINLVSNLTVQLAFHKQSANVSVWSRTKVRRFVNRHFDIPKEALTEVELRKLVRHFNEMAKNPPLEGMPILEKELAA